MSKAGGSFVFIITSVFPLIAVEARAADLGTAFTYQGSLEKPPGTPVNDTCDFRFGLWDAAAGGNQQGASPQTVLGVSVSAGVFTVPLDFGAGAIDGMARWLEIETRCPTGVGGFSLLSPRVELTPAPHSLRAGKGVGGPNALNVTPSSDVGIGTTSPGQKLDVVGTIASTGLSVSSGTVALPANQVDAAEVSFNYANSSSKGGPALDLACADCVTSAEIVDGTISSADIADNSLTASDLAQDSVDSNELVPDAVRSTELAADLASLGKMTSNVISTAGTTVTVTGDNATSNNASSLLVKGFDNQIMLQRSGTGGTSKRASIAYNNEGTLNDGHGGIAFQRRDPDGTFNTNAMIIDLQNGFVGTNRLGAAEAPPHPLTIGTSVSNGNGAHCTIGGVWTNGSDRNSKQSFEDVDRQGILRSLAELPVTRWQYKGEPQQVRHIGPVAQDFYAAFGTGEDERYIGTIDADGVALAAIQGLYEIVQEKDCEVAELRSEIEELKTLVKALAALNGGGR